MFSKTLKILLVLIIFLSSKPVKADGVIYIPVFASNTMPIYGNVGDTFTAQSVGPSITITSKFGVEISSIQSGGECQMNDMEEYIYLFCKSQSFTVEFKSNFGQSIYVSTAAALQSQMIIVFGNPPASEEMPSLIYAESQTSVVNEVSYFPIQIANMGSVEVHDSVYLNLPDKDVVEVGALPADCINPEESGAIVCYGIDVVPGSIYQLKIPLTWKRTGSFSIEAFALEEGVLIRGGHQRRVVNVSSDSSAFLPFDEPIDPASWPYFVYGYSQNALQNVAMSYVVYIGNLSSGVTLNTVHIRAPASDTVTISVLPTGCTHDATASEVVCTGMNVPPNSIIKLGFDLIWKKVGVYDMNPYGDVGGTALRGSRQTREVRVLAQQN